MKSVLVPTLSLALLIAAGLLFVQQHRYEAQFQRQERAISLVQSKYDALLRESQLARQAAAQRQLAHQALPKAKSLAPRYAALDRITGYTAKASPKISAGR